MKLTKYTPLTPIDTVFDRLHWGFPVLEKLFNETEEKDWTAMRLPKTNIQELDNAYVFSLEMPGISKKDVEVSVEGESLIIKGECSQTEKTDEEGLIRREFRAAKFERSFTIGSEVDRDKVCAKMEDGVLTVTLPKTAEKLGRKVDVS